MSFTGKFLSSIKRLQFKYFKGLEIIFKSNYKTKTHLVREEENLVKQDQKQRE